MKGFELLRAERDKEAMVYLLIVVGKRCDLPALYREFATLLHRYGLYEEELTVLDTGLEVLSSTNHV